MSNYPLRPNYSKGKIDRAGITACSEKPGTKKYNDAVNIINEWRAAHNYPIQTFNNTLRRKANIVSKDAVVARRLKRLSTILDKIGNREDAMRLSRMQDIGGVRAIVPELTQVYKLRDVYLEKGRFPHILKNQYNYIKSPKSSGYRGVHLVYQFNNVQGRSPYSRDYDGLNIEVQLRTQLQHEWATAVEVVGTILQSDLKSSKGDKLWLEFFQCMSSVMAIVEGAPVLEDHRGWKAQKLFNHTASIMQDLDMFNRLSGWIVAVRSISEGRGGYYHILLLDVEKKTVRITGFEESDFNRANIMLAELEAKAATQGAPAPVLVAAGDIKKIKKAYPNYFLDMREFLKIAQMVIDSTVQSK